MTILNISYTYCNTKDNLKSYIQLFLVNINGKTDRTVLWLSSRLPDIAVYWDTH